MSTSLDIEQDVTEASPAGHRTVRVRATLLPTLLGIFCAALALRLYNISTSNNIFIDEVLYSQVGGNVADGRGVSLFGRPFNLHPPAPFAILGGVARLFGLADGTTNPDTLLLQLRPAAAVFGALIVVVVFLVMRRCGAGRLVTAATTTVVALDPFQISFDSRVMLEAFAQFFAISAVGLLLVLQARDSMRPRTYRALVVAAGVAAGLVMGSKETFGLVVGGVLVLLLVCPRLLSRRSTLAVMATGVVTYVLVVSVAWVDGGFGPWLDDKTSGLRRLIGTEQTTGFNAGIANVTLTDRIFANVGEYGATYLLLLAGGIVTIVDLVRRRPWRHDLDTFGKARTLVSLWNLCACGYLVYATLIGSIEEQMYYIPLVPCILSLGLAASAVRGRIMLRRVLAVLVAAVLVFQGSVWVHTHTNDQNRYESFLNWQRSHILSGSRIGVTDEPASFLVKNALIGQWPTIAQLRANQADYVLIDSSLVEQGYSKMADSTYRYLLANAPVAYSTTSDGATLYLFDLRGPY